MIRFNNDYNHGALGCVMKTLSDINSQAYPGYGADEWCERAENIIKNLTDENAGVYFFPGATQTNIVALSAMLNDVQSVISADTGHINSHEAGSTEHAGHKIIALEHREGKITSEQIERAARYYYENGEAEYLTEPKAVYISFPTEFGTLYSRDELIKISAVCRKYGMYLFVDGARMSYGLSSEKNNVTLKDFASLTDVFYLGGTKCGALFGEALVIVNDTVKRRFRTYMKQNGAVLAKGWLLGAQFSSMLSSGEYFTAAERADKYADEIKRAFLNKNIPLAFDSPTNQQFAVLSRNQAEKLSEKFIFDVIESDENTKTVRFCTSWSTTRSETDALIEEINKL